MHLNVCWPIKCAVSMHLHAFKTECITLQSAVSNCMFCSLFYTQGLWHWPWTVQKNKKKYASAASQQSPRTHAVLIEYLRQAARFPKAPSALGSHTNMELKILEISLLQNIPPQHSHIKQIVHFIFNLTWYGILYSDSWQRHALVWDPALFSHAQRPLTNSSL